MADKSAEIQFANVPNAWTRSEVELKDGGLVVNSGNETHFRVEISLGDPMTGIDVEPVIGIGKAGAQGCVVAVQARGPGLCVVSAQI